MQTDPRIVIVDTTFRDGQQSPLLFDTEKYRFTLEEKKQLLAGLIELGVTHFEFFSPVVGEAEAEDVRELIAYAKSLTPKPLRFLGHCRTNPLDIEKALEVGCNGLNLYLGVSPLAQRHNAQKSLDEAVGLAKEVLRQVRAAHPKMYLRFSAEDAFRTPLGDLFRLYDAVYPYVDTLGLPDTVGIAEPEDVTQVVSALRARYPRAALECHFHNDRGLALANVLAAVRAGVRYVDASIWGLAERSGIPSITGVLFNLSKRYPELKEQYNLSQCYPLNVLMASILGTLVPYTEPVSLTNRTHTAGVHQKAVLNEKKVYEAHNLHDFGVDKNQLLLGPLSGWHLIYYYLKEVEAFEITREQAKRITQEFKSRTGEIGRRKKPEELLLEIALAHGLSRHPIPEEVPTARLENLD
ncbi:MAG: LeuA family protein [Meiothermus sp.]|uniref:LeuA family protein n=1 Tax=Meiothermus sp. TaxID=1955249 RepID=UPI0025E55667|nr:LeuA family protein [Meiothermus sp.]MCS7059318.1 LeuA family protein [Meiothermus sp.]MCS7195139.1 LeuA family protein [Meiothermus sp.]MCX7740735.1 LeuA family protein [Meiothermus sp.]MDW8091857.1 LeuA family protein [Meiothermus sp.]MDW8482138.1 LeuA family protein [Meiothermus sp.]